MKRLRLVDKLTLAAEYAVSIYLTVGCPSVCLSRRSTAAATCSCLLIDIICAWRSLGAVSCKHRSTAGGVNIFSRLQAFSTVSGAQNTEHEVVFAVSLAKKTPKIWVF